MKKFFSSLSKNTAMASTLLLLIFVLLPVKVVIFLVVAYCIVNATGVFKIQYPDVWELEENYEDTEKSHKVFLTIPTRIEGQIHVFCYVNCVIIDGVTTLSLKPIAPVFTASDKFEEVQEETIN
jgi:hypothetical protein